MLGVLSKVFGSGEVINAGVKLIDDLYYSDSEEAADKRKMAELKTKSKIELMNAYAPFKVAQRYLALMFSAIFLFILVNGVIGSLYGIVDMENVRAAKDFANEMWLGEIIIMIMTFYFGGGLAESIKRDKKDAG